MDNDDEEFELENMKFFEKVWNSITNFEIYPEMATEGVGRAFLYLIQLMLVFSIIMVISTIPNFNKTIKEGINLLNENFSEISYSDGNLTVETVDGENKKIVTDEGTVIFDTNAEISDTQIREYEEEVKSGDLGVIWLNNKVIFYSNGIEEAYYYNDTLEGFNVTEFKKSDLTGFLENSKMIYVLYFVIMLLATFFIYFISTLIDILVLSIFGMLAAWILKIKIKYRGMFNMSVYALTISILLKLIYIVVNNFIDFNMKYFDFMYSAIGYICLIAAIFMIKSDVVKRKIQMMAKINKEENELEQEENPEDEEEKDTPKEDEDENKDEKKDKTDDNTGKEQGSEA